MIRSRSKKIVTQKKNAVIFKHKAQQTFRTLREEKRTGQTTKTNK